MTLSRKLKNWELAAYASPAAPLAMLVLPVHAYLPALYATELNLSLIGVGLTLLAARLLDVITDPLLGLMMDRFRNKLEFRYWAIIGLPCTSISCYYLFFPANDPTLRYLFGWSMMLYVGWTMLILPLYAWGAELSGTYHGRTRITGAREAAVVAGVLTACIIAATKDDISSTVEVIGICILVLLFPTVLSAVILVPQPPQQMDRYPPIVNTLKRIAKSHSSRSFLVAVFLNSVGNALPASLFIMFAKYRLEISDNSGLLLAAYFASGLLMTPFWLTLSRRIGKSRTWIVSMLWACVVFPWALTLSSNNYWEFFVICVLTGASLSADLSLPPSIQADLIEKISLSDHSPPTGIYFGLLSMITKLAPAIAIGIAFALLDMLGLNAIGGPSNIAVVGLALLYCFVPIVFKLLSVRLIWNFGNHG